MRYPCHAPLLRTHLCLEAPLFECRAVCFVCCHAWNLVSDTGYATFLLASGLSNTSLAYGISTLARFTTAGLPSALDDRIAMTRTRRFSCGAFCWSDRLPRDWTFRASMLGVAEADHGYTIVGACTQQAVRPARAATTRTKRLSFEPSSLSSCLTVGATMVWLSTGTQCAWCYGWLKHSVNQAYYVERFG